MRRPLARLAACLTYAAPAAAGAQATTPEFTRVLSTYALAGCATPVGLPAGPCVRGLATYGQLGASQFALRLDLAADFSGFVAPTPLVGAQLISGTRFRFSTVGATAAECAGSGGPRPDGRCVFTQFGPGSASGSLSGPNVLPGQVASYLQVLDALSGGFAGSPATFRLEDVMLVYDVSEATQTTVRVVFPSVTVTPEPATFGLAGVGLLLVAARGGVARRRSTGVGRAW